MRFSFVLLATVLVCVPLKAAEKPAAEKPAAEKPAAEKPAFTGAGKALSRILPARARSLSHSPPCWWKRKATSVA